MLRLYHSSTDPFTHTRSVNLIHHQSCFFPTPTGHVEPPPPRCILGEPLAVQSQFVHP